MSGYRRCACREELDEDRLEKVSQRIFAYPAERQTCERYPELGGGYVNLEVVLRPENGQRAAIAFGGKRLHARASGADKRELRRDEEPVDQCKQDYDAEFGQYPDDRRGVHKGFNSIKQQRAVAR